MLRSRLAAWPHWPWLLWAVYAAALAAWLARSGPLTQDAAYHAFADARSMLGIPRFADVVSNLAILAGGLAGLCVLWGQRGPGAARPRAEVAVHGTFYLAVTLTALGSAYYHWAPDSARLVWDRLPLSGVAACFPALVLAERAPLRGANLWALVAWLALGPLTVVAWWLGDAVGGGDLRAYTLVKAVSFLGTLGLLAALAPRHSRGWVYVLGIALYGLAAITEAADRVIFQATGFISGHTLKHLLAGVAVLALAWMLASRTPLPAAPARNPAS